MVAVADGVPSIETKPTNLLQPFDVQLVNLALTLPVAATHRELLVE